MLWAYSLVLVISGQTVADKIILLWQFEALYSLLGYLSSLPMVRITIVCNGVSRPSVFLNMKIRQGFHLRILRAREVHGDVSS